MDLRNYASRFTRSKNTSFQKKHARGPQIGSFDPILAKKSVSGLKVGLGDTDLDLRNYATRFTRAKNASFQKKCAGGPQIGSFDPILATDSESGAKVGLGSSKIELRTHFGALRTRKARKKTKFSKIGGPGPGNGSF